MLKREQAEELLDKACCCRPRRASSLGSKAAVNEESISERSGFLIRVGG